MLVCNTILFASLVANILINHKPQSHDTAERTDSSLPFRTIGTDAHGSTVEYVQAGMPVAKGHKAKAEGLTWVVQVPALQLRWCQSW